MKEFEIKLYSDVPYEEWILGDGWPVRAEKNYALYFLCLLNFYLCLVSYIYNIIA